MEHVTLLLLNSSHLARIGSPQSEHPGKAASIGRHGIGSEQTFVVSGNAFLLSQTSLAGADVFRTKKAYRTSLARRTGYATM